MCITNLCAACCSALAPPTYPWLQTRGILTWITDAAPGCHHSDVQYTTVAGEACFAVLVNVLRRAFHTWHALAGSCMATFCCPGHSMEDVRLVHLCAPHSQSHSTTPLHAPQAASFRAPRCWAPAPGSSGWWVLVTSRSAATPRPGAMAWCRCPQVRKLQAAFYNYEGSGQQEDGPATCAIWTGGAAGSEGHRGSPDHATPLPPYSAP